MFKLFKKKSTNAPPPTGGAPAAPPGIPKEATKVSATRLSGSSQRILIKPLVSEKTAQLGGFDTYGFVVGKKANKVEIAKAFQAMYNVKPKAVRLAIMPEKRKRLGRIPGVRAEWKKALIRVPKGSKVDVFAGV